MKFNYKFCLGIVATLFATLLLGSCDKGANEVVPSPHTSPEGAGVEIELSLEGSVGEELRGLHFEQIAPGVGNKLQPAIEADSIEVLCIVRSSSSDDNPIYKKIWWQRDKNYQESYSLDKISLQIPRRNDSCYWEEVVCHGRCWRRVE